MDTLTAEERSARMALIKSKGTAPEVAVRRMARALGARYRGNRKDLPGNPDLAFGDQKRAVFVHGCFWHRHDCQAGRRLPKSHVELWTEKFERNVARDRQVRRALAKRGWRSLIIWECELSNPERASRRLERFLDARN
ncbi:very short patch repair endonuclease [Bradyrhizobium symbiodeficiens]|uniref:very short patch repair endonuclease n=1 Tax=Bradyrhizobium symbiodeficiens TaxID=1404367 RepID=UPI000BA19CEA|nr:very short patch repair endonuclease [Bradyrhizobium symbiodeficiens]AWM07724.1 DNA mismatch endonuclease Vsr [Bradyrhizobium symbiodeficiens]